MARDADDLPKVDASGRTLGARPGIDMPEDATAEFAPGNGGMSAALGDPNLLPIHRRPPALAGTGKDPVFAMGIDMVGADLQWRDDVGGPAGHGFVEPVRRMTAHEYQQALWATRAHWVEVNL